MTEKQHIERSTIEAFLTHYNRIKASDYRVEQFADEGVVPDAFCRDTNGNELNVEVTLTEDRPKDIQALLGRSDHKSVEAVQTQNERVRRGLEPIQFSSLEGNVTDQIVERISGKLRKRYGPNTALVIRDASPLDWGWGNQAGKIKARLDLTANPFDRGVWILSYDKSKIHEIISGSA